MLEGPHLDKPNLSHSAFQPKSPLSFKNTIHSKLDSLLRRSLLESYLADEFIDMALDLFPKIMIELEALLGNLDDRELPSLELLYSLTCLIGNSSSRMAHLNSAAFVANRVEIRDSILKEFDTPQMTKNILRGSGFLGENIFGPLPESLKTALSSINAKEVMCRAKMSGTFRSFSKPKSSVTPSKGQKRTYTSSSNFSKRSRFDRPYSARRSSSHQGFQAPKAYQKKKPGNK